MDWLQTLSLALMQGLTEFLPISSSAHLILPRELLGWPEQGLAFDVALHVGTLAAVLAYFRVELLAMARGFLLSCTGGDGGSDGRLAWMLIIATVPLVPAGLLIAPIAETHLRSMLVIAFTTIFFGLLLGVADRADQRVAVRRTVDWRIALLIGFAQALALVPGTSRSGITMTAGLFAGLGRTEAARFSFLLSIPAIVASGSFEVLELLQQREGVDWARMAVGSLSAGVVAFLTIHWFLRLVERVGMMPFVIYRVLLGAVLLAIWFA
jgi:undecaprenyl-diphosphatase